MALTADQTRKMNLLKRYRRLIEKAEQINNEIAKVNAEIDGLRATTYSGMPSGSGGFHSIVEDRVIKLTEISMDYQEQFYEAECLMHEIEQAIKAVEDDAEQMLLRYRYIDCLKWESICVKMNYSWDSVHRIHHKALDDIIIG